MGYIDTLSQHQARWQSALAGRANWTREAWVDMRVASNKAWSPEEIEVFRKQRREPSNYPIIHPVIEATCGIEAQTRSDIKIASRIKAHMDTAEALTNVAKFVDDQNKTARHRSRAFRDEVITGVGYLEVGKNPDPFQEPILKRRVSPFDIWGDPTGKEDDLSDYQDMFRAKWLNPSWLLLNFPQLKGQLPGLTGPGNFDPLSHTADYTNQHGDRPPVVLFNNAGQGGSVQYGPGHGMQNPYAGHGYATQDGEFTWRPDRYEGLVLAVERWYRCDEIAIICRLRNGMVLENTPENAPIIARAVVRDGAKLSRRIVKRMRCAIFADDILIQDELSDLGTGDFPFVPYWAYKDEEGQPLGLVRLLRDTVRDFNARKTHLTKRTTMRQVHYEEGAFVDEDEALLELAKFNGAVRYADGALTAGKVLVKDNLESSSTEVELLHGSLEIAQNLAGATAEMLGQATNATSGVAIQQRSQQGQTALYSLFDSRNFAQQQEGEQTLALIQQEYTEEMEVRITGSNRGLRYITINQDDPTQGMKLNDVSQGRYDVIVADQPASPTERAAKVQAMAPLIAKLPPQLQLQFLTGLAEAQDMDQEFIEQLDKAVKQVLSQPQGAPEKPMSEVMSANLAQLIPLLSDEERGQALAHFKIQAQGQRPNAAPQEGQEGPPVAPPVDPNQAMQLQADLMKQQAQHAHEAQQSQADRYHEAMMAGAGHAQNLQAADLQHQQALEQGQQAADLAPPPAPAGGSD